LIRAGPETPVFNFTQLKELLTSTDLSRLQELDWIAEGKLRYLDGAVDLKAQGD